MKLRLFALMIWLLVCVVLIRQTQQPTPRPRNVEIIFNPPRSVPQHNPFARPAPGPEVISAAWRNVMEGIRHE
jgi:hypothetical protein